jgi:hypothetical protein
MERPVNSASWFFRLDFRLREVRKMTALAHYQDQPSKNFNRPCPDLMTLAERELSAFFNAVAQSFGSEQAQLSAEDWLRELISTDRLPASAHEWRLITAKASTRLAGRVRHLSLLDEMYVA